MVASLAIAVTLLSGRPRWFATRLAGYPLESRGVAVSAIYDPATGYYLYRTAECDGADIGITLTRDRNMVSNAGFYVSNFKPKDGRSVGKDKVVAKRLAKLSTGRVKIGDTEATVLSNLGKPKRRGKDGRFLEMTYEWIDAETPHKWSNGVRKPPFSYSQTYTLKAGRVIQIALSREMGY